MSPGVISAGAFGISDAGIVFSHAFRPAGGRRGLVLVAAVVRGLGCGIPWSAGCSS
jgi:hypothetical protein